MKKLFGLFLCMLIFVGITACDSEEQKVKLDSASIMMLSQHKLSYPELYKLSGTTWRKQVFTDVITETIAGVNLTTTNEIPRKQGTTTFVFNSNGSFTATYEERYLPDWDSRLVDSGSTSYSVQHQSSTNAAFVGYTGQYCTGASQVQWYGYWERIKVESIMGDEDDYTYDYRIKIVRKVLTTRTIVETSTTYNVVLTMITDDNVEDEDNDWSDAIALDGLSVGGADGGTELIFDLSGALAAPFTDGTYTKI